MGYSAEVVRRARQRLEQAKADRQSQQQQNLQQAYDRVPRLREIDRLLRQTMAQAARTAFTQGSDVQEIMNQIKEENLSLQREREALIAQHFAPGFLDDSPLCPHCGGSGYVGSTMCACMQELCRQEQRKELTLLHVGNETFDSFRLDVYPDRLDADLGVNVRDFMRKTYQSCWNYAQNFTENAGNLLFSGNTGLGKTFLSACIARTVADKGYSVVYESATHLFSRMEQAKFGGDEEAKAHVQRYQACDLLIVDDLGTEMGGQFTVSALYTLLNDRLLAGKPMIISTNLNPVEFARRYSPQIASRLDGQFKLLFFLGDDIRVRNGWGN
ncbi:MAG: ATP-binding protein [Oscillospiraceae bacterium]|nr:ATP-binding protein [Oscillospiraceae bacterium]